MEIIVRMLAPVFGPPLEYYAPVAQAKATQAERIAASGQTVDVVFIGSSTVLDGVDIAAFEAAGPSAMSAYNAALNAADTYVVRRFLLEDIAPELRPRIVVYGISEGAFIKGDSPQIEQYDSAPATRIEPVPWYKALAENLYLYRYRNTLRDPLTLNTLVRSITHRDLDQGTIERFINNMTQDGDLRSRAPWAAMGTPIEVSEQLPAGGDVNDLPSQSLRDVEDMAQQLRKVGIDLVLAHMPATQYSPQFAANVRALAEEVGAKFLPAAVAIRDTGYFYDGVHLNERGAELLATYFARKLPLVMNSSR